MSFGVSTWHGTGDHMAPLMERADRALYISKEKGRNSVSGEDEVPADTNVPTTTRTPVDPPPAEH